MADEAFDIVVVGAGAGGMTAAAVAAAEGRRVLLVDAAPCVGGTTAISGGMVWVPANHLMAKAGLPDSLDDARRYLGATVPADADPQPLAAFLERGAEAIRYLETRTSVHLRPVLRYPDYYPDLPGATAGGRVLEPLPFDGRTLGNAFALLRPPSPEFTLFGGMMVSRADIPHLRRAARSAQSAWHVAKLLLRYGRERLHAPRGTTLHLGNALAGRLLKSVLDLGVELRLDCTVVQLLQEEGRVMGVELKQAGGRRRVRAKRAVILASGGLSNDAELRGRHVPMHAGALTATVGSAAFTSRLNPWKTNPILRFRRSASSSRSSPSTSTPSSRKRPPVGRSRQPKVFIIVLLPEPLAPMMATNSPGWMVRVTPRTAWTWTSPLT